MDKQQLQASLEAIHQELGEAKNVDESTRQMLVTVMSDIAKVLKSDAQNEPESAGTQSDAIRGTLTEFEAEHPQLARSLSQVADALSTLGI